MKTENIISAICAASGAVCGSAAGKGLSFELKSGKAQKMAAGQLCELRGVICSAGDDRKAALEALDTAADVLCGYRGDGIYRISAPSPGVLYFNGSFRFEREIIIIAGEEWE